MTITMSVHGAAQTVTGSCYLLDTGETRFLVDCGMFQGAKTVKQLNYEAFPFDPESIDFVLLTHAHIDHSGLIPKLVKHGFAGPIYATRGTIDLLSCMLPDSGHIQEFEVQQLNRRNAHRGRPPVTPMYTVQDAEEAMKSFSPVSYDDWVSPCAGIRARFWNAGHILGSASIEVEIATGNDAPRQLRILFSGDIGPDVKSFHPDPDSPENLDFLVCESTYGNRDRPDISLHDRREMLASEVNEALSDDGVLVVPAFAVERTQEFLADLFELIGSGKVPHVPIFLDSPLAIRATKVFVDHADELEDGHAFKKYVNSQILRTTETVQESMGIERFKGSHIVVAASGMCDAGRIRHHLKNHLWRRNSTVMIIGYQARGTLGQFLLDGAKAVRIQGEEVKVRARIRQLDVYSGHADGSALARWVEERAPIKRGIFLTHGEEESINGLHERLSELGMDGERIVEPMLDDMYDLTTEAPGPRARPVARRLEPEDVGKPDWHNEMSELWLDVAEELEQAADNRARKVIIRRLRRALKED